MLALPPGAITHHVVPQLTGRDRLHFALASRAMRSLVTVTARNLRLKHCDICTAAAVHLGDLYPNVRELSVTLSSIHDAMYAVPKLLLHARHQHMKLEALVLYDSLPDSPMEPPSEEELRDPNQLPGTPWQQIGQQLGMTPQQQEVNMEEHHAMATGACAEDHQWDWEHDLSSVILSVSSTFPHLQRLTVRTLMMSDAECSAISLLTGLKELSCLAEEGCQPGALCSFTALKQLKFLYLGDTDGNDQEDVETVCKVSMQLTRLAMGYCPRMQPPVLRSLACRTDGELEELEVNIDAEEGQEILFEMIQLSSLKRLTVDSTDEFDVDPGFGTYDYLTNLQGLTVTMPMSLVNTQSLEHCKQLKDLLLCTLPGTAMEPNSLRSVTSLELLWWGEEAEPALFAAFPSLERLVLREGADDIAMEWIGKQLSNLRELHLRELKHGYSCKMLQDICKLPSLSKFTVEMVCSSGMDSSDAHEGFHNGFRSVRSLCLSGVPMSDELLEALIQLPQLETLRLVVSDERAGLTQAGMRRLLVEAPKLQEVAWKQSGVEKTLRVARNMYGYGFGAAGQDAASRLE